jgi:hypothetical protein
MKITKSRLKEIIKEEVEKVFKEGLEETETPGEALEEAELMDSGPYTDADAKRAEREERLRKKEKENKKK